MSGHLWKHFDHGADIGIWAKGQTLETAFEQIAIALSQVISEVELIRPAKRISICCKAADKEMLLVAWLDALIYQMSSRRMLFSRFKVNFRDNRLYGSAWGESVDVVRHKPAVEVKGATLTELGVVYRDGFWEVQTVVDV